MLPNLYKIAGELTATRACQCGLKGLGGPGPSSIFGDHGDVMATRGSGWRPALCFRARWQGRRHFAAIATARQPAAPRLPVPALLSDGFRTSHEIQRVELIDDDRGCTPWCPRKLGGRPAAAASPPTTR